MRKIAGSPIYTGDEFDGDERQNIQNDVGTMAKAIVPTFPV